jgi:hypothetical protein
LHLVENTPFGSLGISRSLPPVLRQSPALVSQPGTLEKEAPPGESGASFGKQGIGRGRSASEVRLRKSKKGSKQQRRLSGVCSLGGVAVQLDRQFPSTGMCVRLGKRFIAEQLNLLPGVFSATPEWTQPSGSRVFRIGHRTGCRWRSRRRVPE